MLEEGGTRPAAVEVAFEKRGYRRAVAAKPNDADGPLPRENRPGGGIRANFLQLIGRPAGFSP